MSTLDLTTAVTVLAGRCRSPLSHLARALLCLAEGPTLARELGRPTVAGERPARYRTTPSGALARPPEAAIALDLARSLG